MTATAPEVDEEVKTDSPAAILNRALKAEEDSETILGMVKEKEGEMNGVNVATALHRLATINKKKRVAREALFRDSRFALLLDAIDKHSAELQPRSVADVLWSLATLQHFPARLLKPVITSLVQALQKKTFEAQHLSTAVWALASLETRPMRLSGLGDVVADNATVPKSVLDVILVRIEAQAVSLVSKMNQQNCANLLWGFAKLDYQPTELLPKILKRLVEPGMLVNAKPVEVADTAYSLAELNPPKDAEFHNLTKAIAARVSPDGILDSFSSRQLTVLMSAMLRLDAISALPEGRLDEWISAVRKGHEAKPMISADARNLEKTLATLGREASWVKRSEMLNNWVDMASGTSAGKARAYSDDELHAVFKVIDTDKSGDIDQDELLYAMQKINKDVDAQMVKKMLDMADSDGDYQVSFEEFKQIMVKQGKMLNKWVDMASGKARTPKKYSEEELLATFKAIDTDDSGDIDQRELLKAIQEINPAADARMVEKMLNFADADGDRQVSFDEFKQIMAKQSELVVS
jgi:Ca2+-binding EF-hand superfamily protein